MEIKVEKINVSKSYDRNKIYTPEDITSEVIMPIIDVERLDTTLDTSSITLLNNDKKPIVPFTRMKITITNDDGTAEKIYRLVYTDNVEKLNYTVNERYKHYIELIEPTKWLERFEVDNTTITNYLAWLYHEGEGVLFEEATPEKSYRIIGGFSPADTVVVKNGTYKGAGYTNDTRILNYYINGTTVKINARLNPEFQFESFILFFISTGTFTVNATLKTYTITTPSEQTIDAKNLTNYTFSELGTYTFEQTYEATQYSPNLGTIVVASIIYRWTSQCVTNVAEVSQPRRYTIKEVCNNILSRIGDDASTIRTGIELPMFQLDSDTAEVLDSYISPEFTFTQNTLFGVLSQIGNEIHAIPRLIPTRIEKYDENNNIEVDDYSSWTTITFDFLGGSTPTNNGQEIAYENTQNGDNYATSFVSNIQNSFQTNNADYVSLTEPYSDGYISTRTEDASFEISNNGACIKTSRPIQRIVSLEVWFDENNKANITSFVKEATDYSILLDYATNIGEFEGYSTKNSAIYYTRGKNVISGLDYLPPVRYQTDVWSQTQAINNIIKLATNITPTTNLKDLMFRIKYIPFYNIKAKQFKQYIDDNSGDNELFYNQVNTQSVDIESLGENIKGALLRTANEEPTITAVFKDASNIIHAGQLSDGGYYAYEVNKQITNTQIKATTKFSKDWNKLNEYVAIKKNYREWEISERESIETTPCYNEFCIISDELDFDKGNIDPSDTERQGYIDRLKEYGGFLSNNSIEQIYARLNNTEMIPEEFDYAEELGNDDDVYRYAFYPNDINDYAEGDVLYYEDEPYQIDEVDSGAGYFAFPVLTSSKLYEAISNNENFILYRGVKLTAIEWALAICKSQVYENNTYQQIKKTFLLPASCCSFGNSVLVNFGAVDNYSVGTYVDNKTDQYALEQYLPYGNKYGNVETMELRLGSGLAKENGFSSYANAKATSKELYSFDINNLYTRNVLLDYSKHDFTINKDSRQALNFTIQLHFVSDSQKIWIGKALAQSMPFCGNTEENIFKFVYFTQKPDKFCQTRDSSIWTEMTMPICTVDYDLKYIKYAKTTVPADAVGFGLVDNQNRIVLYYDKEIKAGYLSVPEQRIAPPFEANTYYSKSGDTYTLLALEPADWSYNYTNYYYLEYTDPIYFQFRRKI